MKNNQKRFFALCTIVALSVASFAFLNWNALETMQTSGLFSAQENSFQVLNELTFLDHLIERLISWVTVIV